MTPASGISAIVPTIGRPEALTQLLESLAAQSCTPDEVLVADGSGGSAVARVVDDPRWAGHGLRVRRIAVMPPNAVRQRQAAIAEASGSLLLLLDDDVVLEPQCVEAMARQIAAPGIVAVTADFNNQEWSSPTTLWRWYLRWWHGLREGDWQGRVIGPLLRFGYRPSPAGPAPMEWLGSGNSLVRREAYDRAGGFSDFFLHRSTINEDVDLGLKLARVGRIVLCPSARLAHMHAPGGRVSPAVAAEDDLYNRYLILRRTQGASGGQAFALAVLYFTVETASNLLGCLLRLRTNGIGTRTAGRLRALARMVTPHGSRAKHYWALVMHHKRPSRFVMARILMATGACRWFTIRQQGFMVRFHPANLSSQLWIDPHERDEALAFFRDYLKPGDRVVDVGANIGDTVLTASVCVGPSGHVTGIEAHPRTFRFLQQNIALNRVGNVDAHNVAAGAAPGTARFSDDRRDDMNRIDGGNLLVPVVRLDDLIADPHELALLKIDVEGYEKFVLEGAPELLTRTRCVHFEVSAVHFRRFGYSTGQVVTWLHQAGFCVFRLSGPHAFTPITAEFDTERFENLLALRDVDDFVHRTGWHLQ